MATAAELVQQSFRILQTNPASIRDAWAENIVWDYVYAESAGVTGRLVGVDAILNHLSKYFGMFEKLEYSEVVIRPLQNNEECFVEFTGSGVVKATGKRFTYRNAVYGRSSADKVVEVREYYDSAQRAALFKEVGY